MVSKLYRNKNSEGGTLDFSGSVNKYKRIKTLKETRSLQWTTAINIRNKQKTLKEGSSTSVAQGKNTQTGSDGFRWRE